MIHHLGERRLASLVIYLETTEGKILDRKTYRDIVLEEGNSITRLPGFRFKKIKDGTYALRYEVSLQ